MINFIYGMICGLGIVVIVGLIFMLKAYKRQKFNRTHKFITFPIVNKEELKDNTRYVLVKTFLCNGELYTHAAKWDKKIDAFRFMQYYDKYEDVIAVFDAKIDPVISEYNPAVINALDIEELNKICFELSDESVESDEIWEKLIEYFEKRNILK